MNFAINVAINAIKDANATFLKAYSIIRLNSMKFIIISLTKRKNLLNWVQILTNMRRRNKIYWKICTKIF